MPALNWNIFGDLPGAGTTNFEMLCRSIIRRHYGQFGEFRALLNQPGVEFHLRLDTACALGGPGRWYGWQCRWYDLPSGTNIGAARRAKIKEAIEKTEQALPGVTDWVLWTRHTLTRADQDWFYSLDTKMKLALWSNVEVEDYLVGPAEVLRDTYFGELVLTSDLLTIFIVNPSPLSVGDGFRRRIKLSMRSACSIKRLEKSAPGLVYAKWSRS